MMPLVSLLLHVMVNSMFICCRHRFKHCRRICVRMPIIGMTCPLLIAVLNWTSSAMFYSFLLPIYRIALTKQSENDDRPSEGASTTFYGKLSNQRHKLREMYVFCV